MEKHWVNPVLRDSQIKILSFILLNWQNKKMHNIPDAAKSQWPSAFGHCWWYCAKVYTSLLKSNLTRLSISTKMFYPFIQSSEIVSSGILFIPRKWILWVSIFSQHYLNCEIIRITAKFQQEICYINHSLYTRRNNMQLLSGYK